MNKFAQTLPPSTARAQCHTIANYHLDRNETIAARIERDHRDSSSHLRVASLVVEAGAATESKGSRGCYGTFTFQDGSTF